MGKIGTNRAAGEVFNDDENFEVAIINDKHPTKGFVNFKKGFVMM